jgi:hypothetical protein
MAGSSSAAMAGGDVAFARVGVACIGRSCTISDHR